MNKFFSLLLAAVVVAISPTARADVVKLDLSTVAGAASVTNQFAKDGVTFSGFGNAVVIGAFYRADNGVILGLLGDVTNPFPGNLNGIIATFENPVYDLSFDLNAGRIGSAVKVNAFLKDGHLLRTDYFSEASYYKGHYLSPFSQAIGYVEVLTLDPNQTPVGVSNIQFSTSSVPEPKSFALFGIALAGLGLTRRKLKQA